jgi:hypothetical protein
MINETAAVEDETLNVLEGIELQGRVNVEDETILRNVASSIRRGHQQIRPHSPNADRVVIIGSGPSLNDSLPELRELLQEGAKLVTLNGAYKWALEHNLTPRTQIVMDARPSNARFVLPLQRGCNYVIASQAAPELWDELEAVDPAQVFIFHAAAGADGELKDLLDKYYLGQWYGVGGGTTVATRALSVLRTLGYLRFDLFGIDSCFLGDEHHAFPQDENKHDTFVTVKVTPPWAPTLAKSFRCAPWHIKQFEDFLQMIRVNGEHMQLAVHGPGLVAYALETGAASDDACFTYEE